MAKSNVKVSNYSYYDVTGTASSGGNIKINSGSYPTKTFSESFKEGTAKFFSETKYSDWLGQIGDGVSTYLQSRVEYINQMKEANDSVVSAMNNRTNAQRLELNEELINKNTQQQISKVQFENVNLKSQQKEIESASGFSVDSGSFIDMANQADFLASQTVAALTASNAIDIAKNNYQKEVLNLQASLDMVHAEYAMKTAKRTKKYGAISGALQVTSGIAGVYGKYNS